MGYFKKNLISLKVFLSIILKYKFGYTLPYPSKVFIEPTNECNLRCTMCVHGKGMNRKKGKMKMDSFMKIIDEVSFNKPWIILHMAGTRPGYQSLLF